MKRLILIMLGLLFSACPGNPYWEYDVRSFVNRYYDVEKIVIQRDDTSLTTFVVQYTGTKNWDMTDVGEKKAVFDRLCEKHDDVTCFRRIRVYAVGEPNPYEYRIAHDFVSCELSSDADWDELHPAGTSLGDLFRFESNTPLPYIRSDYTRKYAEVENGEYYPVDRLVSELQLDDMTLLPAGGFYLHLLQPPTLSRRHTLEVRLTSDEGEVFTDRITVEF